MMIYILKMIQCQFIKLSLLDGLKVSASSSGALSTFFSAIVHKPSTTFDCLHFDVTPSGLFEIGIINICNVLKKDETGIVWKTAFLV